MTDIIEKARALWAALKEQWAKLTQKNDSGGGGGPGPVR